MKADGGVCLYRLIAGKLGSAGFEFENATDMSTKGKIGVTTENIFPVIKQFLYSDKEVFLRELVANAVDATKKLQILSSNGDFTGEMGELKVQ